MAPEIDAAVDRRGRRGLTGGPIWRSGPSDTMCSACASIAGNGEAGDHSELELEPGESELQMEK